MIGSAAGGKLPNFIRQAISSSRAFVAVRFEPPMKDGIVQRNKSLGVPAPNADDRKSAVHGSEHQPCRAFEALLP